MSYLIKKLLVLLCITTPTISRIYVSKHQYIQRQIEIRQEEYEQNYLVGAFNDFKDAAASYSQTIKRNLNDRFQKLKQKLTHLRPRMMNQIWAYGRRIAGVSNEEDEDDISFEFEEMDIPNDERFNRNVPYKAKNLNPGIVAIVESSFIENVKDVFVPDILDVVFNDPLHLNLQLKKIKIHDLYLDFHQLDISKIGVFLNKDLNAVEFRFPESPLYLWAKVSFKIFNIEKTGEIKVSFNLQNPNIVLLFEDDPTDTAFTPKIRLLLDDEFNLSMKDYNLDLVFPGIPAFLADALLWLFKGVITKKITKYLKDEFVIGGSTILFYVLDKYYPANYPLGFGQGYINLMFLRKPLVYSDHIRLSLAGDVFSMNDFPDLPNVSFYRPLGTPNPPQILNYRYHELINFQLSMNLQSIQNILRIVFNNLVFDIRPEAFAKYSKKLLKKELSLALKVIFYANDPHFISVEDGFFVVKNLIVKIKTINNKSSATTLMKFTINLVFNIRFIDIQQGTIMLTLKDVYIALSKKMEILAKYTIDHNIKGILEEMIYENMNQRILQIQSFQRSINSHMNLLPIYIVPKKDMLNLATGLHALPEWQEKDEEFVDLGSKEFLEEIETEAAELSSNPNENQIISEIIQIIKQKDDEEVERMNAQENVNSQQRAQMERLRLV